VFKIVSPILISRGISRIVSEDKLIAIWDQAIHYYFSNSL
jgi:hypothetical protein